ncbi:hypothetical protein C6376_32805 [Streptomyces sp. P3]|nr:hypothetical protein C6376_32805 [Streptomyces sp. P3]
MGGRRRGRPGHRRRRHRARAPPRPQRRRIRARPGRPAPQAVLLNRGEESTDGRLALFTNRFEGSGGLARTASGLPRRQRQPGQP